MYEEFPQEFDNDLNELDGTMREESQEGSYDSQEEEAKEEVGDLQQEDAGGENELLNELSGLDGSAAMTMGGDAAEMEYVQPS